MPSSTKRSKKQFNQKSLEGLIIYLDTVESIILDECTTKNITYITKNIINSIRKGRVSIHNSKDDILKSSWEETISRCFDYVEEAIEIINERLNNNEVPSCDKASVISLLGEYVKVLNEEEIRMEKIEEEEKKKEEEELDKRDKLERIKLDGIFLDEMVENLAPV